MSQTAVRGNSEGWGHRSNTQGTKFICSGLEIVRLTPCSLLFGSRCLMWEGLLHKQEPFIHTNHEWIISSCQDRARVCVCACVRVFSCSILAACWHHELRCLTYFLFLMVRSDCDPLLHLFCLQTSAWHLSAPWRTCSGPRLCRSQESWPDAWWRRREQRWKQSRLYRQTQTHSTNAPVAR